MFRATVVRRFGFNAPQFQAQSKIAQQAMPVSNSSNTTSTAGQSIVNNVVGSGNRSGRVAMMPSKNATTSSTNPANPIQQQTANHHNNSFDEILTVGTVSGQGEGQKIFKTAQAEF